MKICPNCQSMVSGKFCPNCGTNVETTNNNSNYFDMSNKPPQNNAYEMPKVEEKSFNPIPNYQPINTNQVVPPVNQQNMGAYVQQTNNTQMQNNQQNKSFTQTIDNFADNVKNATQQGFANATNSFNALDNNKIIEATGLLPTLFWVPLIVNKKNKNYTKAASNGFFFSLTFFIVNRIISMLYGLIVLLLKADYDSFIYDLGIWLGKPIGWIDTCCSCIESYLPVILFIMMLMGIKKYYPIIGKKDIFENI